MKAPRTEYAMADMSAQLEENLRKIEQRELARMRSMQSKGGESGEKAGRAQAASVEAEAERAGAHEIAEAILGSKGQRPATGSLVVILLLGFGLAAGGFSPLWVMLATIVALLIELARRGAGELTHPANLFYLLFAVFHLFIDAVQSFSYGASRFSALFAFGLVYWGLFVRKAYAFAWSNARGIAGSLAGCLAAWLVYGFLPTVLVWLTRAGAGQEMVNVVLVIGPLIALLFVMPDTLLLQSMKQFLLVLSIIALVMYAYNAGLAGSLVNIPGLKTESFMADRWGAMSNFGMLFWTPIKHASVNFYMMVYAPACHAFFDKLEQTLYGEASGIGDSLCPALKSLDEKKKGEGEGKQTPKGLSGWIQARIDFATGQVEETVKEPPGVFLDSVSPQSSAVEGQPVVATSQIRASTLDKPVDINVFCKAMGEKSNHTADSITPGKSIRIQKKDQKGIICLYESLPPQSYSFLVSASFDFKTVSYIKIYFAGDDEIAALGSRDAWFDRFQVADRSPEPRFTPGPVSMAVRIEEQQPVLLYPKASPQRLFLRIPVQNAYQGRLRKINRLLIAVPRGLELEGVYGGRQKGDIEQVSCSQLSAEDAKGCNDDLFNVYDVVVSEKDTAGVTYQAVVTVADYAALLQAGPPAIQYVKVTLDYNYVLEQRSAGLTVEKAASRGLTEEGAVEGESSR